MDNFVSAFKTFCVIFVIVAFGLLILCATGHLNFIFDLVDKHREAASLMVALTSLLG